MADIKVSQLNDGTVDANSYLLESNTGVSYKVKASDIGTFVNTSQADYSLNTTANTIVGAINENVAYDNTTSGLSATTKQGAIDELADVNNDLIKTAYYSISSFTIGAGGFKNLTANDLGMSTPTGYMPIGFYYLSTSNSYCFCRLMNFAATGTGIAFVVTNTSNAEVTTGFGVWIVYIKSSVA